MDLKYVARQLRRRPGHTLAVIACLVIGLVTSVGTFSVITSDPMIFLPMISVLLAVGILAAVVPALRASRIDPIATLRQE